MEMQSCLKASFFGLSLLSIASWLPHLYSFLRTLFVVSLPSVASAVTAPKCLFVFSNIIVVFLVSESKLKRRGSAPLDAAADALIQRKEDEEAAVDALAPMVTVESQQQHEENLVLTEEKEEEDDTLLMLHEDEEIDQCEEVVEEAAGVGLMLEEDVAGDGEAREEEKENDVGERGLPPADELNRRVEDFIAKFNMERKLEARMLVCCC